MPGRIRKVLDWFEQRLHLRQTLVPVMRHPVPRDVGWWYVFGSATLLLFVLQIITGITLASLYTDSADSAYDNLKYINNELPLGWLLRAMHFYGSSAMVVMVGIHMTRVFLSGAFKYPRELTWITGVVLMACTLGMAFSGQVLRWDSDAYWGVGVAMAIAGRVPWIGEQVSHLLLGGQFIGAETLTRFFALHVFILSGLLILTLTVHLYLIVYLGISKMPKKDEEAGPGIYERIHEEVRKHGKPFVPGAILHDMTFGGLVVAVVFAIAVIFGPKGPGGPPDPTLIHVEPRPDWPFLAVFALAALIPPSLEDYLLLGVVPVVIIVLMLVPLLSSRGPRNLRRRPVAVMSVVVLYLSYGVLTWEGVQAPWSPAMDAWRGTPLPPEMVKGLTPLELQGGAVFQYKTCRNCHALDGKGGRRGPDLTNVATILDHDELIRQVVQGGGNMPAFGKELTPPEITALVAFLRTLHPKNQPPATDEDLRGLEKWQATTQGANDGSDH